MTDKEKIKAEIERLKESGCASPIVICDTLLDFIDSLPKKPVSEDLEEAVKHNTFKYVFDKNVNKTLISELKYIGDNSFKDGARWQKEQMMKDAIESEAVLTSNGTLFPSIEPQQYEYCDKVKVIIIKED